MLPFHARPVGPPHEGLRSIKPANSLFDKLMSYRSYRLKLTTDVRTSFATSEVRTHLKNLTLTLKSHAFDGDDPILIFDFLTRFVNEADMLGMSEAQAFVALPAFLKGDAEVQFKANLSGASRLGGVTCWPEAVQYLLETYATPSAMRESLVHLRSVSQGVDETEIAYRKRLLGALHRCGNVHGEDEKMTLYVDGLLPTLRTVVARYRESVHRRSMTFRALVNYAHHEDEAVRGRVLAMTKRSRQSTPATLPRPRSPSPRPRGQTRDAHLINADQCLYAATQAEGDTGVPQTQASPTLETRSQTGDQEDVLYANTVGPRRRSPPRINFEGPRTPRVGWIDAGGSNVICHTCYEAGHIAPQYPLKLYQIDRVVRNFEALDDQTRATVPTKSYEEAKAYIQFREARAPGPKTTDDGDSKKD